MTGIPVHTLANQDSRWAYDALQSWPMIARIRQRRRDKVGRGWQDEKGRGERAGGSKQPSLQQEEEGGKETGRARAFEIHTETKLKDLTRPRDSGGAARGLFWDNAAVATQVLTRPDGVRARADVVRTNWLANLLQTSPTAVSQRSASPTAKPPVFRRLHLVAAVRRRRRRKEIQLRLRFIPARRLEPGVAFYDSVEDPLVAS